MMWYHTNIVKIPKLVKKLPKCTKTQKRFIWTSCDYFHLGFICHYAGLLVTDIRLKRLPNLKQIYSNQLYRMVLPLSSFM